MLSDVAGALGGLGGKPVIYRDSDGVYDGIRHQNGRFVSFYPIGERVLEAALAAVRKGRGLGGRAER